MSNEDDDPKELATVEPSASDLEEALERTHSRDHLKLGLAAARAEDFAKAISHLATAYKRLEKLDKLPAELLSFYGLALVMTRHANPKEASELCRRALVRDKKNGELWLNLAKVWIRGGNVKKAIEALDSGLKMAPKHVGLKAMRDQFGYRQKPVVTALDRDHSVNVTLGKIRSKVKGGKPKSDS